MPEYYDPDDVEYWNHEEAFWQVIHAEEPPFDALIDSAVAPDIVEFEVEESVPDSSASFYTSHPPINLAKLWPPFDALVDLRTPPDGPEPEQDEYIDGPAVDIRLIREALDATQPFDLFEGVTIAETDEQTRFEVPERYIRTPHDGVFILRVYGRQAKLKERDDYGDIRFTDAGNIFWAPHLYPFEEVDGKGLPVIMERERCKLNVSLQPVSGESTDMHLIVALRTPYGELSAREAPESYNSEWISYFKEFQFHGKPLLADTVTYPDKRWASFDEYAAEKNFP